VPGVIVVDAHPRRPAVAERLGLPAAPGLAEVLAGTLSLQRAVQETGLTNLRALTAGQPRPAGSTRLAGEAMRAVLRHLRQRYDLVLVDGPVWDGRPDVLTLGSASDALYVVLRQSDAGTPVADDLVEVIPQYGCPLRGCVLTQH
jgi:Mrp family chromosome partitioning ATPase